MTGKNSLQHPVCEGIMKSRSTKDRMEGIIVRPMTEADLDQVVAVETASYPAPWSRDHFRAELASPNAFPMVAAEEDGTAAGYICPTLVCDQGEILNLAVRCSMRGRGIGRLLLEASVAGFEMRGAERIYLEVRPSNRAALALYESIGFAPNGLRKAYYENGEDAILMEYDMTARKEGSHAV